ncbi:TetR/AcrR family transcriptional regulator [Megasphaera vaginalis (ex Bordigoni et al. 2020)]|uniref:TetR/AcrR family transcriptional regulator n=1 Tax=Megasphaera vaginalis (ex Bordigoni et al. 2020) TaxID=2045301 RepID=UPI000C7B2AAE|nr:TetR/AcrR family transcriptional regulator [Megasphaera vaginalis (ex Bordigoni et al. 2020)]
MKTATHREDGKETRNKILICAGHLIAANGYSKTTSKQICEAAQVNIAAVNYHFGSRDGLYIALLEEVQNYLLSMDELTAICQCTASSREKIASVISRLLEADFAEDNWQIRLWLKEMLAPSPFIGQILTSKALPKMEMILSLFSDYLGYDKKDPRLYGAIVSMMSPFLVCLLGQDNPLLPYLPAHYSQKTFIPIIKENALRVLDCLRKENTCPKG